VRRIVFHGVVAVLATSWLLLALTASSRHHREALAAYVLLLGSLVLLSLLRLLRRALPAVRPSLFEKTGARGGPPVLVELEQLRSRLASSQSSAFEFHYRLRPHLVSLAAARLERRHGVDLSRHPERARALLGEQAWGLLRPDWEPPRDLRQRGLTRHELRLLIETLETI
jgi:hypothetical protein